MSEETIKKVQQLVDAGKGDKERLLGILNALQSSKPLELSDQQYIDSFSSATSELRDDSVTFDSSTQESNKETNPSETLEASEVPQKISKSKTRKMIIAGIVIAAIFFGYMGANAYAVSTLQFRPHQGTQYALSETILHIQAEACNPSFFPVSFHDYEINAVYKANVLETASIMGSTISPKSSLLLDGTFTINKDALAQFTQLGSNFDPNDATVKTKIDAPLFGIIPFTVNKDYSGKEFENIVKNGPPGGYKC